MTTNPIHLSATSGSKLSAKGLATREHIVQAAALLMLENGIEKSTIEDIQNEAQVSASQMYHYFADKHELVMAVIDFQTKFLLSIQRQNFEKLETFKDLKAWRNMVVNTQKQYRCVGGCPIGSIANEIAQTDPIARTALINAFNQWENVLKRGLASMQANGQLSQAADTDTLALALLAAVQGGLVLTQLRKETNPLEAAIDTAIAYIKTYQT
jgi:TetR/AcrR family transcriptional repressor of nem operon